MTRKVADFSEWIMRKRMESYHHCGAVTVPAASSIA
jgi:hypothetical protein